MKTPSRSTRLAAALVAFGFLVILLFGQPYHFFTRKNNSASLIQTVQQATLLPEPARLGLPSRLVIPKIDLDASIEFVGILPDGSLGIPTNSNNVAWFSSGPRPGEPGSAVIDGHYGFDHGKASAFDNLHKLRAGDKMYVTDKTGEIISFVVTETRRYDPNADTSGIFSASDGRSHLNLITCEGTWNITTKTYSQRLVVFSDRE